MSASSDISRRACMAGSIGVPVLLLVGLVLWFLWVVVSLTSDASVNWLAVAWAWLTLLFGGEREKAPAWLNVDIAVVDVRLLLAGQWWREPVGTAGDVVERHFAGFDPHPRDGTPAGRRSLRSRAGGRDRTRFDG